MPTSALSLPVDVPWIRLAISDDMYAPSINATLPEKWRSSVAVYSHEPDPDPLDTSGEVTMFLKLVTTITGYNFDNILILDRPGMAGGILIDLGTTYYPAFCALAQIAVFPSSGQWAIGEFPYFADLQPKQREIVETKTATGEVVSLTSSPLNVSKSATTTQNQSTSPYGTDHPSVLTGTTNLTETTLTDASREKRETTSFQTNLAQLYHLLDTYHTGTNRAMLLTMARPHLVDSVYTFVNGPRRLEGIQEFFLVVRRPAKMTGICVKAVLETAHLDPTDTSGNPATLFTTSRAVSGCTDQGKVQLLPSGPWVTYEETLSSSLNDLVTASEQQGTQAVAAANALGRSIRDTMVASFRDGVRYPLGAVDFLHTNFAMRKLVNQIPTAVLESQPSVLTVARKVETTLTTSVLKLSKQELAARTQLLSLLGFAKPGSPKARG